MKDKTLLAVYLIPLLLFTISCVVYFPFVNYHLEGDGISYLLIAERYVAGDYVSAINGYWSPLNIWLVAGLAKLCSWKVLSTAYFINALSFLGIQIVGIGFFRKFSTDRFESVVFAFTLAIFCFFNMHVAIFADGLNAFLLISSLAILLREDFEKRYILWVAVGLLTGLNYLCKAYAFYIMPLMAGLILYLKNRHRFSRRVWLFPMVTIVTLMIMVAMPWVYILHDKYGVWTLSTAGIINKSWLMDGIMYFNTELNVLMPPSYNDSLTFWEDPWVNRGEMHGMLDSLVTLGKVLARIVINCIRFVGVCNFFSPFYFVIWILSLVYFFKKPIKDERWNLAQIFAFSFILYPLGYFMLSLTGRYLWFTVPLCMIVGFYLLKNHFSRILAPILFRLVIGLYFLSWLPGSFLAFRDTHNEGKSWSDLSATVNSLGIKGSYASNQAELVNMQLVLSYLTRNPYYINVTDKFDHKRLWQDLNHYQVQYYFYFFDGSPEVVRFTNIDGKELPDVSKGQIDGLKIYKLR